MSEENIFIDGMRVYKPSEKAPDFVKANMVIDMAVLRDFALQHHKEGKLRIVLKESKGGNYYAALDTFEPKPKEQEPDIKPDTAGGFDDDTIPF